jgi:phosphoribosyl 1,2-cyclic phosphodiesterase
VHLCGVRGSTPAPGADFLRYGGHTSCVAIAKDDEAHPTLILDAGTGIRSVTQLLSGEPFRGALLLSHLHWDHVQGLPFFAAGDHEQARVTLGIPQQEDGSSAEAILARAMSPPHFPMEPNQLRGTWEFVGLTPGEWECEELTVLAREIPHKGGRTFGYRVSDGHSTFTYMPDHCPTSLGSGPEGCGEYHRAALELAANADVLVHDAQMLTPEELAAEARFGHASADYAVELGRRAGVAQVVLFHHRPDRTDEALDELTWRFANASGVAAAKQDAILQL